MGIKKENLKKLAKILAAVSVVPYLIPPAPPLKGNRYAMAYPESKFITLFGMELHYRQWEPAKGVKGHVLLIHGFAGSTFTWRFVVPALVKEGYKVVALDQICFGLSERVPGFEHSQEARAMLAWAALDAIAPNEDWHLVGHSMGGGTVATMALDRPQQVKSVTFASAAVYMETLRVIEFALLYPPIRRLFKAIGSHLILKKKMIERLLIKYYGRKPSAEELDGYYAPLTVAGTELLVTEFPIGKGSSPEKLLGEITAPCICIWGDRDEIIPFEYGKKLANDLSYSRLMVIPGEGHSPMETSPDIFNNYLISFLDEQE